MREDLRSLNVLESSLFSGRHRAWGLPWPPIPQAAPGFPDSLCDWQEAGYPQGNPSSRLGDPRCRLLLNSAGNRSWQPPKGGGAGFHGNPQLPHPDLEGKEGGRQK